MSRSDPPRSSIVERLRRGSPEAKARPGGPGRTRLRTLKIGLVRVLLWLHVYVSMLGLGAVLFFSVTGLTLNHPDWFLGGTQERVTTEGQVKLEWLHQKVPAAAETGQADESEPDPSKEVAKLEVVEQLRKDHRIGGALADFQVTEDDCSVTFKGPGYAADALIDRRSGHYRLTQTFHGIVAIVNDLHKGRDTGAAWSVVIDVSAVVLTIISLTGLGLIFFLKLRRRAGLVVSLIGAAAVVVIWWIWVP